MGGGGVESAPLLGSSTVQFKPFGLFWNIVKSFAGAGTFALPWAVMNAGLWGGIVGIILVALLSNFTIRTLLKCGDRVMRNKEKEAISGAPVAPPSYPEIGKAAWGPAGAKIISTFSGLMCFGVCIAYFNLIGANMQQFMERAYPHIKAWEVIWVVFPVTVFLSCLTDLTKLAYTSIAGSIALLIAMGSVVIYGFKEVHFSKTVDEFEWKTIPLFLGGAAFLFLDHVILMPLANSCGNIKKFPRVLDFAMIFVTVVNIIFAAFAYAFFGSLTCGSVIDNLPVGSVVGDIVRIGISAEVLASFPLVANAGFQSIETGFGIRIIRAFPRIQPGEDHPFFSRNIVYYAFRGGCIAFFAVIASTIQSFGLLVSLVGSLTIAATGFIFPQLFYLKLFGHEVKTWDKVVQLLIVLFGIGMTSLGTYQSVDEIVQSFGNHNANSTCVA